MKHPMDMNTAEVHLELTKLLHQAGDIEARMLLVAARRWIGLGQEEYGKVELGRGRRWRKESLEETVDQAFYNIADDFEEHIKR